VVELGCDNFNNKSNFNNKRNQNKSKQFEQRLCYFCKEIGSDKYKTHDTKLCNIRKKNMDQQKKNIVVELGCDNFNNKSNFNNKRNQNKSKQFEQHLCYFWKEIFSDKYKTHDTKLCNLGKKNMDQQKK
jgi:hypothetical protein